MKFTVNVGDIVDNEATVEVNGVPYKVELDKKSPSETGANSVRPHQSWCKRANNLQAGSAACGSEPSGCSKESSSRHCDVDHRKVGDVVKAGDKVGVLESMKMENDILTSKAGTVKQILVSASDTVQEGDDLMIIE